MPANAKPRGKTALQAFEEDLAWCQQHLWIQPRDGLPCRLVWNPAQRRVIAACRKQLKTGQPVRVIILKARQLGISTLCTALAYAQSVRHKGIRGYLLGHQDQTTKSLWAMHRMYVERTGMTRFLVRKALVAGPLVWRWGSQLQCHTAGGRGVGHGETVSFLHLSEAARYGAGQSPAQQRRVWETVSGIRAALSRAPYSIEIIESTAWGLGWFYEQWQRATSKASEYEPVFIGWYLEPSYVAPLGTCGLNGSDNLDDYERGLVKRFKLTLEQLAWRRRKIADDFGGSERLFREQFPSTPEEAFLVAGSLVFDAERLQLYLQQTTEPIWTGELRWDPPAGWIPRADDHGPLKIWELPRKRRAYVIGADVAECLDDASDEDAAVVRDADSLAIVAKLQGRFEPGEYANYLAALAWYYNGALLAVERNGPGFAVIGALRGKLGGQAMYARLFRYRRIDAATGKATTVYGWNTNRNTKPPMIEAAVALMRTGQEVNPSAELLGQMATFVHGPNRRMEAATGAKDDLVIASAIAAVIAPAGRSGRTDKAARSARIDELLARSTEDPDGGAPFEFNQ